MIDRMSVFYNVITTDQWDHLDVRIIYGIYMYLQSLQALMIALLSSVFT